MSGWLRWKAWLMPVRVEIDVYCWVDPRGDIVECSVPEGITIGPGNEADTMAAADMRLRDAAEHVHAEFRDRLRRGKICFVAKRGDEVVGCDWVGSCYDHEGPVRIEPGPGEALCSDAFVAISARGRRIHTALQNAMMVWAKENGFVHVHTFARLVDHRANKAVRNNRWNRDRWPRYIIVSSPLLRQFGVRHQLVIDLAPGHPPVQPGKWLRIPPFEREPWEK
jgi:hypothetical protein